MCESNMFIEGFINILFLASHRDYNMNNNQCNHCGIHFFDKQTLSRHKKTCIKKCSECPATFTSLKALNTHIDATHSQCKRCGKNCGTRKKLQRHARSCKKQCNQCSATFMSGEGLERHVQTCHEIVRELTCST